MLHAAPRAGGGSGRWRDRGDAARTTACQPRELQLAFTLSAADGLCQQEGDKRGHDFVGTEHLMKALADGPAGVAGWMLLSVGVREQLAREP